jgi:Lysine methyltransferase
LKTLKSNLLSNKFPISKAKNRPKLANQTASISHDDRFDNIIVKSLDWETDSVTPLYQSLGLTEPEDKINLVVACDCIYNESLIAPFVSTCVDICRLCPETSATLCIVAQQLRSPDVFEAWLKAFHTNFRTWRLPDKLAFPELGENSGFVVHLGILRDYPINKIISNES